MIIDRHGFTVFNHNLEGRLEELCQELKAAKEDTGLTPGEKYELICDIKTQIIDCKQEIEWMKGE